MFCQQVSEEQYHKQKKETSQQQLTQLLDSISADENMSTKTRKQRLKQVSWQSPLLL